LDRPAIRARLAGANRRRRPFLKDRPGRLGLLHQRLVEPGPRHRHPAGKSGLPNLATRPQPKAVQFRRAEAMHRFPETKGS
jgi:hypothetical protein